MHADRPLPSLSPREQQLLKFAAEGLTDTAIANRLGISEATVGTYWGRVRIKLGPFSRTELVAIIMRAEQEVAVESLRRENEHLVRELQERSANTESPHYHEFLDNAPDAMILVNTDGTIEYSNVAANELFGYAISELHGKEVIDLMPPQFREKHSEHREDYMRDPARRQMGQHLETPALKKGGVEFPIRAALSTITTPGGMLVMCAIRPA